MYNGSERRSWSINQWMKKMANFLRIICIYISNLMQRQRVSYFTIITVTEECMLESWSRELPFPFISLHFWTKSFTNWNFCVPVTCEYVYVIGPFFFLSIMFHKKIITFHFPLSFSYIPSICKSIACLSLVIICMWIFIYTLLHFLKR